MIDPFKKAKVSFQYNMLREAAVFSVAFLFNLSWEEIFLFNARE